MNDIKSSVYAQKVELLLRLIPIVMEEHVFAIHGGTAINLFLKDLPRYSVDIDLTYIPLADRQTSLDDINIHLKNIAEKRKESSLISISIINSSLLSRKISPKLKSYPPLAKLYNPQFLKLNVLST